MIQKFKQLATSSLIYGIGNYGVKLVGFFLIPLYTRYLNPSDYGVMSMVSSFGSVLFIILNLGQSTALFRYYYEQDNPKYRDRVIAGSLWIGLLAALPITVAGIVFAKPLAQVLLGNPALGGLVMIGVFTVACRALLRLPFAVLRARGQDKRYASWSITKTALSAILAIAFVTIWNLGVSGVLLSQLLAEASILALLMPSIGGALRTGWAGAEMRGQFLFGISLVPGAAAGFVLDLSDRFFLKHYSSMHEVGLYSLGYRMGEIISFVVSAFNLAWPQFIFSNKKSPDAPRLYSYAATYYLAAMLVLVLGVSMLAPEAIRVMATARYQSAAKVVPIVALAGMCEGLSYVGTIGIVLLKKPLWRSGAVIAAGVVNIGLNFLLIPRYGMMGAAWATLFGFVAQMLLQVGISLRHYPIPYQWDRLAKLAGTAAIVYAASMLVPTESLVGAAALKLLLLGGFPLALWFGGFFEPAEVAQVVRLRAGVLKRLAPSRS